MRQINRDYVARYDGGYRRVPGETRPRDSNVDAIAGRAEKVPAAAERVGEEWDDVLPLDQQKDQIVCDVIADGDGYQCEGKSACDLERAGHTGRHPGHDGADAEIATEE